MKNGIKKVVPGELEATVPNSNWGNPHRVDPRNASRSDRLSRNDQHRLSSRRYVPHAYAAEFPRYQKLLLLVLTAAMLLAATSNTAASDLGDTVFRTVGPDGVVSFNDFGDGEAIALAPARDISAEERAVQRERHADILDLAERLAQERRARSRHRTELATALAHQSGFSGVPGVGDDTGSARFFGPRFFNAGRFSSSRRFTNSRFGNRRFPGRFDQEGFDRGGFGQGGRFGNFNAPRAASRSGNSASRANVSRARSFGSGS